MGKQILISKGQITTESFKDLYVNSPKVIHFSCDGDYCKEADDFYLKFEANKLGFSQKFFFKDGDNMAKS